MRKKVKISPESDVSSTIPQGNRICNFAHLAKEMFCKDCQKPLCFENVEKETIHGHASVLAIHCKECLLLNEVNTGKKFQCPNGYSVFGVNTRSVLAALHCDVVIITTWFSTTETVALGQLK
ncbi:hypothetical protein PV325_009816 [Microctonus aethiopoides]|uniref:Mutator-like transposase domain-containing protein n=1 Tax=Microctonus aethiopoides TaxID=144406 RepID=A0AA39FX47_9HYME|nr:hypothetical protein PV325_009816 [Microctonus aethiopoides]KAK0075051.1 hypothetical protein PV326_011925 [Microctonus aethiopoides]KAK0177151.1 hypothetical protein PV328_001230 [Microctonus aethiopoides]